MSLQDLRLTGPPRLAMVESGRYAFLRGGPGAGPDTYRGWLISRPPVWTLDLQLMFEGELPDKQDFEDLVSRTLGYRWSMPAR